MSDNNLITVSQTSLEVNPYKSSISYQLIELLIITIQTTST